MSFCPKCGAPVEDGAAFCAICGATLTNEQAPQQTVAAEPQYQQPQQPVYEQPVYQQPQQPAYEQPVYQQPQQVYEQPVYDQPQYGTVSQVAAPVNSAEEASLEKSSFVMGIIGLVLSCSCYLSLAGIIVSAISLKKSGRLMQLRNVTALSGKGKVGHILAKAGLIVGIIVTVGMFIYLCIVIGLVASGDFY